MPPVCSCGATLPEDARFCHRCGRPQRDEFPDVKIEPDRVSVATAPPASSVVTSIVQTVSFSNPLVLRTSLLVASITTMLEIIPYVGFIAPILGGFAAAALYQRRSGQVLTAGSGAKLGWITAILNALLFTIFISLDFAVAGPAMFDALRENVRQQASSPAQIQALQMMNDPRFLAVMVLMIWVLLFVTSSLLYMAGGALAARMQRQKVS
jgi:hypothetical protein